MRFPSNSFTNTLGGLSMAALILSAAAAPSEAQKVTIPLPHVAQPGQMSRFKQVLTLDMTMFAQGQSIPMQMEMVMTLKQNYGFPREDGLTPTTTTVQISRLDGNAMGQKLPDVMKDIPALPQVTAFFDRQGNIHDMKMTGMKVKGLPESFKLNPADMLQSGLAFAQPLGEVEIGVPVEKSVDLPMSGMNMGFRMQYVPMDIVELQGEKAVKFFVTADTLIDLGIDSQKLGLPAGVDGDGSAQISGEMVVGLSTGEVVSQNMDMSMMMNIKVADMPFAVDMNLNLTGYRLQ